MPDGINTSSDVELAQRGGRGGFPGGAPRGGFPGGAPRGGFPGGAPRGGFPGRGLPRGGFPRRQFPGRFPVRQRFPRFFFFPIGFPTGRCYWTDQFGRCCDQFGRCCDRYGRCVYDNRFADNRVALGPQAGGWYGVPGNWDMMADYDDMTDYDMDDMDDDY